MRTFLGALALAALALLPAAPAAAQAFTKPIRVVVPYPAGDLADTIARLLQPALKDALGQPIVIDNKPGASGMLGLQAALQGERDHTLVMGQMGAMAVAPNINKQPFDVRAEFVPVAQAFSNYMLLVANPEVPAKNLQELVAWSKANPGKLRLATNGEGGFPHLAMELLRERAGIDFLHVPYKGSGQPVTDVIGGQAELTIAGFSTTWPHVQSGRLKALGVTGRERPSIAPAVSTFGESVPGYEALGWFGFFAPKGMPSAAIQAVNTAVNNALKTPEVRQKAEQLGLDIAMGTPEQFGDVWRRDHDKWGGLIRNLKLDRK